MADWRRAGARIEIERARRWPTREAFAAHTGLSERVLDDLETGKRSRYAPATLGAVELALGWEPGSCERIAEGLGPVSELDPPLRRIHDAWPRVSDRDRDAIAQLAEALAGK